MSHAHETNDAPGAGEQLRPDDPGFETRLDWSAPDDISEAEASALIRWYEESHGDGSIELTKFVPFLIEYRPGALKAYRRYAQTLHEWGGLPQIVIALMFLHYYMRTGNERGVLYQVIAANKWGATKQEVLDVVQLTFLESGPFGVNAVADSAAGYLSRWDDGDARAVAEPWPAEWTPSQPDFPAGAFDRATSEAAQSELAEFERRHVSAGEEMPAHAALLLRHAPPVLKALRLRYEQALAGCSLPAQFIPLMHLHTAVASGLPREARAAALAARRAAVSKRHVIAVMGFGMLYASEPSLDVLGTELAPVLDEW